MSSLSVELFREVRPGCSAFSQVRTRGRMWTCWMRWNWSPRNGTKNAMLLHAESSESHYRIEVPSAQDLPTSPEQDHKLTYAFDRFFVIRK